MTSNAMDVDVDVDQESKQEDNVDEALYSRQLYVIDHESMKKMQQSTVLIAGMNGLGVEIAKNTILAGVKSVSIFDNSTVKMNDLSSNFYLTIESVGKETRAACCLDELKSLNPYVKVDAIDAQETLESLISSKQYDVIVLVNYALNECIKYNQMAHDFNLRFISCDACGVFGQVFVDFGSQFECTDLTGEAPKQGMVINISKAAKGVVQCHEDSRHGLSDGDFVRFEEVEGMEQLNGMKPCAIRVLSPYSFEIGDTSSLAEYTGNGLFFEVKQGAKLCFNALSEILSMKPTELMPSYPKQAVILQTDFGKDPIEQHLFYLALQQYRNENGGKYPSPSSLDGAESVYQIFASLCKTNGIDSSATRRIRELARSSSGVIAPMCAFLGGVVGQEVLKGCCHKFTPLQQLLYYDAFECLPTVDAARYDDEFAPRNTRYDDNIAVFGATIQDRVFDSRMFLVGAGAIGCEMLKNWALMGVACGGKGRIVVTDMDQIETSNLNRQFLFRSRDVGCAKSVAASAAVRAMNGDVHIFAHENRVGKESENVYNYSFWSGLNCVCTALDNVSARLYVDAQCVYYKKPLLESGTLGTKGNTQIVVPNLTQSYGSTRDPDEKGVPICTLKNFPNKIEHTIQWARDDFEGEFTQIVSQINEYLSNGDAFLAELHSSNPAEEMMIIGQIGANFGDTARPLSFADCVHWARNKFESDFVNRIKQLLYNFPADAVTTEGAKFWSPPKRAPQFLQFDASDAAHFGYVVAAANLRAYVYGLQGTRDGQQIGKHLRTCVVPEFAIDSAAQIAANDEEESEKKEMIVEDYDQELKRLLKELPDRSSLIGMKLRECAFEKDDETNFHMDFIACAANLRARNYRIGEETVHEIKKIAGKIIPAIATTTAAVTGLISFEFYKLLESKELEDYRSSYVNLALPLVTMSEPVAPQQTTIFKAGKEWNYSLWDVIQIKGNKQWTIKHLIDYFDKEWQCDLNMISYGNAMLYAFYMNAKKLMQRKKMKIVELVEQVCKIKIDLNAQKVLNFEVNVDYQNPPDNGDDEPMLPTVVLRLED
eukprot:11337_1